MPDTQGPSAQTGLDQITDEERRRFLELVKKLGAGASAGLAVTLIGPQHAVASGFAPGEGGGPPEWVPGPPPQVPPFK